MSSRENLVLTGFMGSGKSSIGRLIARKLGYRFTDTDRIVSREAGVTIPEIFAREGEASFREWESRALESLKGSKGLVVATGGGIILRERNRTLLNQLGFVVWLQACEDVLFERVSRNDRRPLLRTANPRETIHRLLEERSPLYAAAAAYVLDTSRLTHEEAARDVISEAKRRGLCQSGE